MDMDELVEQVRAAVRAIPTGRVVTYGDIAELVGTGPRRVGHIMATDASDLCWWRVVNASGRLPDALLPEARRHWASEGIEVGAGRVNLRRYRADPLEWASRLPDDFGRF